MMALLSFAHDFEVKNADGVTIYYKITSSSDLTVAVTYRGNSYSEYKNEYTGSVTIPEKVTYNGKTYSVTIIGDFAFYRCSGLTSVTIPNSVTTIGDDAFGSCSGLTSVTIPNSVTSIVDYAFYGCSGLTSITIPNSVTSIGVRSFSFCSSLTSITIPNSVTSIGNYAFDGCSSLTSVTIPNSVTSIGRSVFDGCSITSVEVNSDALVSKGYSSSSSLKDYFGTQVQKFVIGDDVTSIGSYAFYGYSSIASISIGNSVTSIGNSAFDGCSGLKKVIVPDIAAWCNISFGNYAANPLYYAKHIYSDENTEITDLVIPNSVTSIGDFAFNGCSRLTSVTIPNSVTSIGNSAFNGCSGLTSVTIPNSVTTIGSNAFRECSGLTSVTIPNSVTSIGDHAFYFCSGLTSITIPNSVTSIGDYAFSGCSGLTSIEIPNSVTSIGGSAFSSCSGLTSVTINSNSIISNTYSSESNLKNIFGSQVKSYIIGDGVTSIGYSAFYGCSSLTSVTIPNSVTSIGGYAFYNCSGLTSVTIPNSVTSIGSYAFSGCSGLTKVIVPDIAAWCKISFGSYDANPLYYAKHIYSDENTEITDLVIPNSVTSIGSYAFSGCYGLSVTLPDNITTISQSSFPSSTKLYVNIGTKTLLELWSSGCSNIYNKETKKTITKPTLSASATQTTLKVYINEMLDGYMYTCNGKTMTDNFFEVKGLRPGYSTSFSVKISLDDISYSFDQSFSTYTLNPYVKGVSASASSINATGSYRAGDAKIVKHEISCNGKKVEGTNTSFCGLKPNTSYKVIYTITVAYGENDKFTTTYTKECTVKTSELKMTTEQPKVVSVGNVIVSAKANVDDAETNVGFEWRRTDWTDDFPSNTGTAYMYEGTMEGYIRNLNAEKLWKFRPYYLADDGKYYYGDWMGLDPTNTSYFEPTVHTYANINIEGNTALVKGYALGGTDKIIVQGFKYWKAANLAPSGDLALEARKASPAIPADAQTIEAEGRVMEATLSGLDYECTYSYVAFAKTDEGTFYGEVKTFTTGPNTTGIEVVHDADSETKAVDDKVKGIYTLTGVKLSDDAADLKTLKRGIYIVNGRKVAVK